MSAILEVIRVKIRAYTLVELMVAMLLFAFVFSLIGYYLFLSNRMVLDAFDRSNQIGEVVYLDQMLNEEFCFSEKIKYNDSLLTFYNYKDTTMIVLSRNYLYSLKNKDTLGRDLMRYKVFELSYMGEELVYEIQLVFNKDIYGEDLLKLKYTKEYPVNDRNR